MSHVSLYTEVSGPHYGKGAIVYFHITVVSRPPCDHWVLTCALYDIQFFLIVRVVDRTVIKGLSYVSEVYIYCNEVSGSCCDGLSHVL